MRCIGIRCLQMGGMEGMSDGRAGKGAGLVTLDREVVGSNPGAP